ncbi:hypothetical protein N7492_003313 [Penicillium capsulatum]|uniref:Condensation domain-containing protein n=1 Tax=Penicillium capsulatum TaxID=69766 RepID=A0A9W9IJ92_9EURO|nr:hypothetical protein N7492_003313 [Penicillium capsulatum]KAJ6122104.1 hypothetical protein N7512_004569 [Penicillium capsulatum]
MGVSVDPPSSQSQPEIESNYQNVPSAAGDAWHQHQCLTAQPIQQVRNVWLVCHAKYPVIAIQLSTGTEFLQTMKHETLQSEHDAAAWLQETLHVVTDRSTRDVVDMTYSRRLPIKGKRSMLYLATGPASSEHCLVWNMGHVLADAFSIVQFFDYLFKTITEVPGEYDMKVNQLNYSGTFGRLPMTPYEK